ncbi:lysylphosphatidylglycerol synthase domain-containing protein [Aristophania vespae]|uniref:lysylphosphatidylglycerol synthase domain-containing protein n=1 Tax=Aristophania vespae TaxID=2697033 RepID=UPI002351AF01|nr:lysylphosphatidylglycerol synthase domain-containing protein [Aristophania vespae]UMM64677.1 hypothetical protein DM15PD_16940 [Aristophania vespae]
MSKDYSSKPIKHALPQQTKWKRFFKHLPAFFGLVLLFAAAIVIWRQLKHLSIHDVIASVKALPASSLWAGAGATFLAYAILTFYDGLACRQVKAKISWLKASFVAFCAYVLSHNLGFAAISGTAVRYRLYRNWGVPGQKIASIVAFCSITYLLGTTGLVGIVLSWQPNTIPILSHYGTWFPRLLGAACFSVLLLYVVLSCWYKKITFFGHETELPGWKMALGQISASMADMSATALIIWCLIGPLPPETTLTFGSFLGIYLVSYTAGLVANIPGGLGVFDGAMIAALSPWLPVSHIMATILVFRIMYYLVPLILAGFLFASHEVLLRSKYFLPKNRLTEGSGQALREFEADFSIRAACVIQILLGIATICYALFAPLPTSLSSVYTFFIQISALLLIIFGVVLIAAAMGLMQRVLLAWRVSVLLLLFIEAILVFRHDSWFVCLLILSALLVLLPFRSSYYRRAYWRSEPHSPLLFFFLSLCIVSLIGLRWIAVNEHLGVIWWHPLLFDARLIKARLLMFCVLFSCFIGFWLALRKAKLHPYHWSTQSAALYACLAHDEPAEIIMEKLGVTPNGLFYDETKQAALAFVKKDFFVLAVGEPVGAAHKARAAILRLRDYALQENCMLAFLQSSDRFNELYNNLGLTCLYISRDKILFCSLEDFLMLKSYVEEFSQNNGSDSWSVTFQN